MDSEFSIGEPVWDALNHCVGFVTKVQKSSRGNWYIDHNTLGPKEDMPLLEECAPHGRMWLKGEREES